MPEEQPRVPALFLDGSYADARIEDGGQQSSEAVAEVVALLFVVAIILICMGCVSQHQASWAQRRQISSSTTSASHELYPKGVGALDGVRRVSTAVPR